MSTSKTDRILEAIKENFTDVGKKNERKCLNINLPVSGYHNIMIKEIGKLKK